MRVVTHPDAESFLAATAVYRSAQPALTNLIGSVATAVAAGRRYPSESWYSIHDAQGTVGCAMRTAPWPLSVSPMPTGAARELGRVLRRVDPDLPGIIGPRPVAAEIADSLARPFAVSMTNLVRVLGAYVPPPAVAGQPRQAVDADLPLVLDWWVRFAEDIDQPLRERDNLPSILGELMAGERLLLWEVDGEPVAMAGHAPIVATPGGSVGRIGPVFTPTDQRRRGFGAAVTAAMVERLQARCAVIMLFTDASNATSNGVYERLGFDSVAEVVELESAVAHEAN